MAGVKVWVEGRGQITKGLFALKSLDFILKLMESVKNVKQETLFWQRCVEGVFSIKAV